MRPLRSVEGVALVLAEDRELDAIDSQQLIECETKGLRDEDVDLEEGLAALEVGAQRRAPGPLGSESLEPVLIETRIGLRPAQFTKLRSVAHAPEVG